MTIDIDGPSVQGAAGSEAELQLMLDSAKESKDKEEAVEEAAEEGEGREEEDEWVETHEILGRV